MAEAHTDERVRRLARVAAGLILTLAAGVRLANPPEHFRDGRLIPADADSAMHVRRAYAWATEAPWPSVVDPFLGFPDGAALHWSPGWSAALGAFGWLVSFGRPGTTAFDVGVAIFPLLVGVITVGLAMRLADRLWGTRAGLIAGLVAALVPQHVAATQFARPDHNAAEAFFLVALAAEASRGRPRTWAIGLLVAGVCLAWVGGFAYAAIAAMALLIAALISPGERPLERAGVRGLLLGAALLAPIAVKNGFDAGQPFNYAFLSAFQPAWVAAVAAGSAWILGVVHRPAWRKRLLIGGGLVLAAAAVVVGPVAVDGVRQWLVRENPWLATVQEMNPILKGPFWEPSSWSVGWLVLGRAYPFLPLGIGWLGWLAWRRRREGRVALAASTAALFCALIAWILTHLQVRFGWTLAPLIGVVVGGVLARVPYGLALALLLFVGDRPTLEASYLNPKTRQNRTPWTFDAYHWLRDASPPVTAEAPEWGVLGRWWHGHWITVVGDRPQYIGHFGNYAGGIERYHETQAMLDGDADALTALMDRERLRYLLVEATELLPLDGPLRRLQYAGGAGGGHPANGGLRAAFASRPDPGLKSAVLPGAWIYERVPGAVVQGRGEPGEAVTVSLPVFYTGEWHLWQARAVVGADGAWAARVPYWTRADGDVPTGESITVAIGERSFGFQLPEAAVREGALIQLGGTPGEPPSDL